MSPLSNVLGVCVSQSVKVSANQLCQSPVEVRLLNKLASGHRGADAPRHDFSRNLCGWDLRECPGSLRPVALHCRCPPWPRSESYRSAPHQVLWALCARPTESFVGVSKSGGLNHSLIGPLQKPLPDPQDKCRPIAARSPAHPAALPKT